MVFTLAETDADFLAAAPQRYVFAMDLPVPPERVWREAMAGERALNFVRGLSIRWTSPQPWGVGSARVAHAGFGAIRLQERYVIWDDGARTAFVGTAANAPLYRRFAEDYVVEPTATGCRFTWTFAAESRGPRAAAAVNDLAQRALFAGMARDVRRHFQG